MDMRLIWPLSSILVIIGILIIKKGISTSDLFWAICAGPVTCMFGIAMGFVFAIGYIVEFLDNHDVGIINIEKK
jgi:hypothetical protein